MFEFDEHFQDLEIMAAELESSESKEENNVIPVWNYIGNDVWKLEFETVAIETSPKWLLNTVDLI